MNGRVWMSSVLSPSGLGEKQGTRTKYYNHNWNPASFKIPVEPDEVYAAYKRHRQGYALQRENFPEAEAVFDERRFGKARDLFFAGPFFVVKGKLAEVLALFDLGEGGLIPFTIYQADLVTPMDGEFFLLNFGARKNTILLDRSQNVVKFAIDHKTGVQYWKVNSWSQDGDLVLSAAALEGPDLWFEEVVYNKLFMSDALASALVEIGMSDVFRLKECRIVEAAQ